MKGMNVALAIFGSFLGLLITGIAIYTAWMIHQLWKRQQTAQQETGAEPIPSARIASQYLSRWTVLDYGVLGLFVIGTLLLLADMAAVMRDRAAFPDYHYAYLLCGIVFTLLSMLMLLTRLAVVLSCSTQSSFSPDHHHEPSHADHAEQGIENG